MVKTIFFYFSTELRSKTENKFHESSWKSMNSILSGKLVEDVRKRKTGNHKNCCKMH